MPKLNPIPSPSSLSWLAVDPTSPTGLRALAGCPHPWVAGHPAGTLVSGVWVIGMADGKSYSVNRLVWRLATGEDPGRRYVLHRNGDRLDNRLDNLYLANPWEVHRARRGDPGSVTGDADIGYDWRAKEYWARPRFGPFPSLGHAREALELAREAVSEMGDVASGRPVAGRSPAREKRAARERESESAGGGESDG